MQCKEIIKSCLACCCGIAPIPIKLWEEKEHLIQRTVKDHIEIGNEIYPFTENLICCFLKEDYTCTIHETRPEICRRYGKSEELPCAFLKPNGKPRSEAQRKHWQRKINHNVDDLMRRLEKRMKNGDQWKDNLAKCSKPSRTNCRGL